jgi:hypothetical protein
MPISTEMYDRWHDCDIGPTNTVLWVRSNTVILMTQKGFQRSMRQSVRSSHPTTTKQNTKNNTFIRASQTHQYDIIPHLTPHGPDRLSAKHDAEWKNVTWINGTKKVTLLIITAALQHILCMKPYSLLPTSDTTKHNLHENKYSVQLYNNIPHPRVAAGAAQQHPSAAAASRWCLWCTCHAPAEVGKRTNS